MGFEPTKRRLEPRPLAGGLPLTTWLPRPGRDNSRLDFSVGIGYGVFDSSWLSVSSGGIRFRARGLQPRAFCLFDQILQ